MDGLVVCVLVRECYAVSMSGGISDRHESVASCGGYDSCGENEMAGVAGVDRFCVYDRTGSVCRGCRMGRGVKAGC